MTNLSGSNGDGKATAAHREAEQAQHDEQTGAETGSTHPQDGVIPSGYGSAGGPVTGVTPADVDDPDA